MKRTVAHLSDLHFGRVDPAVLPPLRKAICSANPDVVVVSGDFTQRARTHEFQQARAFLDTLPRPCIAVPGNHDVPLHNRFLRPLRRYEHYISADLSPQYEDEVISIAGVNTARALAFKNGRINRRQIEAVRAHFCAARVGVCKILVAHHPLDVPLHWTDVPAASRSAMAFEQWLECGVDVILSGHEHRANATNEAAQLRIGNHSAIMVQAGTATSTRMRGEANSFNLLHVETDAITVERKTLDGGTFHTSHTDRFSRASIARE